jgi:hypothetical protein
MAKIQTTLTAMLALILMTGATSISGCASEQLGQIVGAYSADRAVTADDLAVFKEAVPAVTGVQYTPKLVATQVVAGTNYRFTTTATTGTINPVAYTAYVYVYKPLQGKAVLTNVVKAAQ